MSIVRWFMSLGLGVVGWVAPVPATAQTNQALVWDGMVKELQVKTNELTAKLSFSVTNVSAAEVVIQQARPSCGCTLVTLPGTPWRLAPGASGTIQVATDLRGKHGILNKFIAIDSTAGFQLLRIKITLPELADFRTAPDQRSRNQIFALADRQLVFKGDCAQCHVTPTLGKTGEELYEAACAICHQAVQRATMVPDLKATRHPNTREYWRQWTANGRAGTLMPGFDIAEGGPLTGAQMDSLVDYLMAHYRYEPAPGESVSIKTRPGKEPENSR